MTNRPYIFEFDSTDVVITKLSNYLEKNFRKRDLYTIEEDSITDIVFVYILTQDEAKYFLINIYLPTRIASANNPPEEIDHVLYKSLPAYSEQINLLHILLGEDKSVNKNVKLQEDDKSYTLTLPAGTSVMDYLRSTFILHEMERIRRTEKNKKEQEKRRTKSNYLSPMR